MAKSRGRPCQRRVGIRSDATLHNVSRNHGALTPNPRIAVPTDKGQEIISATVKAFWERYRRDGTSTRLSRPDGSIASWRCCWSAFGDDRISAIHWRAEALCRTGRQRPLRMPACSRFVRSYGGSCSTVEIDPGSRLRRPGPFHFSVRSSMGFCRLARRLIHDLVMLSIEALLWKRGYPSVDHLKSGKNDKSTWIDAKFLNDFSRARGRVRVRRDSRAPGHPAARRPDNVMRRTRSYAGGRRNPSIPPERFRCATIVLANLGRATGRFVRSPTAPRPLVFLLGSVLKAGLCRAGLDCATTCPHSLQGPP